MRVFPPIEPTGRKIFYMTLSYANPSWKDSYKSEDKSKLIKPAKWWRKLFRI